MKKTGMGEKLKLFHASLFYVATHSQLQKLLVMRPGGADLEAGRRDWNIFIIFLRYDLHFP